MRDWIQRKYKETSAPNLYYVFSVTIFLLGMVFSRLLGSIAMDIAIIIGSAGVIGGFVSWCMPAVHWISAAWESTLGKIAVALLHFVVFLVATVMARSLVSESLGLPPQSFDVTVGFLIVALYIPALMAVASIALFFFAIVMSVVGFIQVMALNFIQMLTPVLEMVGLKNQIPRPSTSAMLHSFGSMMIVVVLVSGSSYMSSEHRSWVHTAVKALAVLSDFHLAVNYPGGENRTRIHPLENGFVAFAKVEDDRSISIHIRTQEDEIGSHQIGTSIPSIKQMTSPLIESLR
ncbi:hypothetical protein [Pseudomonas sp. NPDC087029]|uniref:hypothetical protein n=1 Tax=Pseudomonas sp. NPDC087029 TaxID=3364433 RepID=UPI0038162027